VSLSATARLETRTRATFAACAVLAVVLHVVLVPLLGGVHLRPGPPGLARSVEVRFIPGEADLSGRPVATPQEPSVTRAEPAVLPAKLTRQVLPATTVAQPREVGPKGQATGEAGDDAYLPRSALTVPPVIRSSVAVPYPMFEADIGHYVARLSVFIDETGSVRRVDVETEDLPDPLKVAARDAFVNAEFTPGELEGRAVRSRLRIEVSFDGRGPRS